MNSSVGENVVLLLSGGLDSTTVLALAASRGMRVHALTFRYGQRHDREVELARLAAARYAAASHRVVDIDIASLGGSALTSPGAAVPKSRSSSEIAAGIPSTYVPARNTIFLAFALGVAEVTGSAAIHIGVNAIDYSGYPDCRPEYLRAFAEMARLATRASVEQGVAMQIEAPLLYMSKAEIITLGRRLGVDHALTSSCYDPDPDGAACGTCDACQLRLKGFREAGAEDPATYAGATGR